MPRLWCLLVLLLLGEPAAAHQLHPAEPEVRTMMNEHHHAVEVYRAGRTVEALSYLTGRPHWLNRVIANRILRWMKDPQPRLKDSKDLPVKHWNAAFVVALGSLHMEAALEVYRSRGDPGDYRENAAIAKRLFDYIATEQLGPRDLLSRWTVAIGSLANAEGQFWWAVEIFGDECTRHEEFVEYLVACASTQETIATFPAHVLLGAGQDRDGGLPAIDVAELTRAIVIRDRYRATAQRALEDAIRRAPAAPEARIRLAHIFVLEGAANRAVAMLEPIVANRDHAESREVFLARLLLGRAHRALGQLDAAIQVLEDAVDDVPSAQSARVALAEVLHRSGRVAAASDTTLRMFNAPAKPPHPWGSYPFGQYWLPRELFSELREEAQR